MGSSNVPNLRRGAALHANQNISFQHHQSQSSRVDMLDELQIQHTPRLSHSIITRAIQCKNAVLSGLARYIIMATRVVHPTLSIVSQF